MSVLFFFFLTQLIQDTEVQGIKKPKIWLVKRIIEQVTKFKNLPILSVSLNQSQKYLTYDDDDAVRLYKNYYYLTLPLYCLASKWEYRDKNQTRMKPHIHTRLE